MDKKIPEQVKKKAENLINMYGENIEYLGNYKDSEYYTFVFPQDTVTGFPFIYIYYSKSGDVMEITGFEALDIIGKFKKE